MTRGATDFVQIESLKIHQWNVNIYIYSECVYPKTEEFC